MRDRRLKDGKMKMVWYIEAIYIFRRSALPIAGSAGASRSRTTSCHTNCHVSDKQLAIAHEAVLRMLFGNRARQQYYLP